MISAVFLVQQRSPTLVPQYLPLVSSDRFGKRLIGGQYFGVAANIYSNYSTSLSACSAIIRTRAEIVPTVR